MPIDLRSDTVTLPSPAMRRVMAEAEVGDDQYGEDPSVNRLQERVARLLGKEAALFMPTGTMANQVAIKVFTQPGDDVIVPWEAHVVLHETGAAVANSGIGFTSIGSGGVFNADDLQAAIKPRDHMIYPPTTMMIVENTHNRAGGIVFPPADLIAVCELARSLEVSTYCDGARLFNAALASGCSAAELAAPFDLVSLSLSKGLGAPAGSMLAGSHEVIQRAIRYRRMLGGAMRQVGILAAAGIYAIERNVDRLAEDHRNAGLLAKRIAVANGITLDPARVETNIIVFAVADAPRFVAECRAAGVLLNAFGPRAVRAVTHLDVDRAACEQAAEVMSKVATQEARG
jgi:threonine aldolase